MPKGAARSATLGGGGELLPANLILAFDGTNAQASALTDYTRVASLDGFFLVGVDTNNPGDSVGSATHTHTAPHTHPSPGTHTHGWAAVNLTAYRVWATTGVFSTNVLPNPHTHPGTSPASPVTIGTSTPTSAATSIDPPFYEVIWMETLVETKIAAGMMVWSDTATIPPGWSAHTPSNTRMLKGAAAGGNAGATGGASSHSHTDPTPHTHPMPHSHGSTPAGSTPAPPTPVDVYGGPVPAVLTTLTHSHPNGTAGTTTDVSSATASSFASTTVEAPNLQLLIYEGIDGAALFQGMIIATLLSAINVPAGWSICDGTNGTPNLKARIIKNTTSAPNVGVTGGSATHNHSYSSHGHTGTHGHPGTSGPATPTLSPRNTAGFNEAPDHTHPFAPGSATIANASSTSSSVSSFPASKAVLFLRKD